MLKTRLVVSVLLGLALATVYRVLLPAISCSSIAALGVFGALWIGSSWALSVHLRPLHGRAAMALPYLPIAVWGLALIPAFCVQPLPIKVGMQLALAMGGVATVFAGMLYPLLWWAYGIPRPRQSL